MKRISLCLVVAILPTLGFCELGINSTSFENSIQIQKLEEKYKKTKEECFNYDECFADLLCPSNTLTHVSYKKAQHNTPVGWIAASALAPFFVIDVASYSLRIPASLPFLVAKNKECKKMKKYRQELIDLGQNPSLL